MSKKTIEKTAANEQPLYLWISGMSTNWYAIEVLSYDSKKKGRCKWKIRTLHDGKEYNVATGSIFENPLLFKIGELNEEEQRLLDACRMATDPVEKARLATKYCNYHNREESCT